MEKLTPEQYFEMATANTSETRPTVCADECLALMRDYAAHVLELQSVYMPTKREYYKIAALSGFCGNSIVTKSASDMVKHSAAYADAMIEEDKAFEEKDKPES